MPIPILVNRGGGSADDDAPALIERAFVDAGIDASVREIDGAAIGDEAALLAAEGAEVVVVAGGDGSIGAAAGALAGTRSALGIIPLGTRNHFARDLGIPIDIAKAAAVIACGSRRRIDVADLNGRTFVNNSAIGLYPLMVVDRDSQQQRLGRSKRLAMLVASVRTLVRFHDQRLRLKINDEPAEIVDTPLLFVGNNDYRLSIPAAGRRPALDDARLCVLVMRSKGVPGLIAATLRALVGRTREDDMIALENVQRLCVTGGPARIEVSIDGETERLALPLDYRIRPAALTVIAPAA